MIDGFPTWSSPARAARCPGDPAHPGSLMTLPALLAHVADFAAARPHATRGHWLGSAFDACAHLLAARDRVKLAFDAQRRIDRLLCVASGRPHDEAVRRFHHGQDMQRVQATMKHGVNDAMIRWRNAGEDFTRECVLLPTQVDPAAVLPDGACPDKLLARVSAFVRSGKGDTVRIEALLDRHMRAHRHCVDRAAEAMLARERRRSLDFAFSLLDGAGLHALSVALLDECLSHQAWLAAEADRAGAQWAIECLVTGSSAWMPGVATGSEVRLDLPLGA